MAPSFAVKKGDGVIAGQQIGAVGYLKAGPHLHFEIKQNGVAVDPLPLLGAAARAGGVIAAGLIGLAVWYALNAWRG
jgi:murein DD-endopeptidase MepM/ murein hydrolase activator NlpD